MELREKTPWKVRSSENDDWSTGVVHVLTGRIRTNECIGGESAVKCTERSIDGDLSVCGRYDRRRRCLWTTIPSARSFCSLVASVERENVLEAALRTYEESERSLKSICKQVEDENQLLHSQYESLEKHQKSLFDQYHSMKERLHHVRGDHARLAERQLILDQQTNLIQQRFVPSLSPSRRSNPRSSVSIKFNQR